ncbi:heavy metal-binding domain-containing protein [Luteolibacter marinus]|uniref:heavy metal-binding domain-containing protein n=1 Tax=Luteolibacter marinus TaxID=2776705 RepID=UPI0018688283|nr:heavy metal-binding domain-containing protein [Luteolibacter marinus]
MDYILKTSAGKVTPCDEAIALRRIEEDPSIQISRPGTNHWIYGKSFLEFGDLAFDDTSFRVPTVVSDLSKTSLLITAETVPPYTIASRLGVVVSERVASIGALKELAIGLSDIIGNTSATIHKELEKTRNEVLSDLRRQAHSRGAQGIIALSLSYTSIEGKGTLMLLVTGYGTAVTFAGETDS